MQCVDVDELGGKILADKLSKAEEEQFITHLRQCPQCQEQFAVALRTTEGMLALNMFGPNQARVRERVVHLRTLI